MTANRYCIQSTKVAFSEIETINYHETLPRWQHLTSGHHVSHFNKCHVATQQATSSGRDRSGGNNILFPSQCMQRNDVVDKLHAGLNSHKSSEFCRSVCNTTTATFYEAIYIQFFWNCKHIHM